MVKVKICGVTNFDDALLVANLGAEYIGINFWPQSPRKVSEKYAKEIAAKMPPFTSLVGVFVDEDPSALAKTAKKTGIKLVQLHGNESPEYVADIKARTGLPVIKAFRIKDETSLDCMAAYAAADYFLLDAYVEGEQGGTGQQFNWDLAVKAKDFGKPIFVSGGLTPENVTEAIQKTMPFAVDTASGVERLPRRKDYDRMNQFIRKARGLK